MSYQPLAIHMDSSVATMKQSSQLSSSPKTYNYNKTTAILKPWSGTPHNSMATNTNNGSGGRQSHLSPSPSSSSLDGSPCPDTYYYTPADYWSQSNDDYGNSVPLPVVFAVFLGVVLLLRFFCNRRGVRTDTAEQDAGGGHEGTTVRQLQSNEAAAVWVGRSSSSTVAPGAAVEMAPPLVCTYRKAEELEEDSCGVCLADLADGEAVMVLPACMHYFHAPCVGEWLRRHNTCPLCRSTLVGPGGATPS